MKTHQNNSSVNLIVYTENASMNEKPIDLKSFIWK